MNKQQRIVLFQRVERATEIPMLILSAAFLLIVLLPEIAVLSQESLELLEHLVWLIWGCFALELLVKTYLAPNPRQYLLSHWPDVLVVALPFLRPLRILRVIAIMARLWRHTRKFLHRQTLSFIGVTSLITIVVSALLVYGVERRTDGPIQTLQDALWWAMATITTVGYGDVYPTTALGRGVAVFLMLTGITLFGLLTAKVAAFFVEEDTTHHDGAKLDEIINRLQDIEQQLHDQRRQYNRQS